MSRGYVQKPRLCENQLVCAVFASDATKASIFYCTYRIELLGRVGVRIRERKTV